MLGQGGDDILSGGDGMDRVQGGEGADDVWGGAGLDMVQGGEGVDECFDTPQTAWTHCESTSDQAWQGRYHGLDDPSSVADIPTLVTHWEWTVRAFDQVLSM